MIKISVIVPVYNCEKLLRYCLASICGQTIDKSLLEVILVDDRSSDGPYEICQEYEKHYPYIHALARAVNSRGCSAPPEITDWNMREANMFFLWMRMTGWVLMH